MTTGSRCELGRQTFIVARVRNHSANAFGAGFSFVHRALVSTGQSCGSRSPIRAMAGARMGS
jgi:hypothetical protein